jgi:hypothetical protein
VLRERSTAATVLTKLAGETTTEPGRTPPNLDARRDLSWTGTVSELRDAKPAHPATEAFNKRSTPTNAKELMAEGKLRARQLRLVARHSRVTSIFICGSDSVKVSADAA